MFYSIEEVVRTITDKCISLEDLKIFLKDVKIRQFQCPLEQYIQEYYPNCQVCVWNDFVSVYDKNAQLVAKTPTPKLLADFIKEEN